MKRDMHIKAFVQPDLQHRFGQEDFSFIIF